MKVFLDCLPCFLRQALEAARRVTDDERVQRAVLDAVASIMPTLPLDATPIDLGRTATLRVACEFHRMAGRGTPSPFGETGIADLIRDTPRQ